LKRFNNEKGELGIGEAISLIAIVVIIIAILAYAFSVIVPKGTVGVVEQFGVVYDDELSPGFYLISPLKHVEDINIQTQEHEFKQIEDTLTKEGLKVKKIDASIIYRIVPEKASDLVKTVKGDPFDTLVAPYFFGILRDEIKRWTAEDIYTGKSSEIQADVYKRLSDAVGPRGVIIEAVLLRGMDLPDKVTVSIESKIAEMQAVGQKQFEVEKEKLEAERKIIEAKGIAEANRIKGQSITPEIINWEFVQSIKQNQNAMYVPYGANIILPAKNQ